MLSDHYFASCFHEAAGIFSISQQLLLASHRDRYSSNLAGHIITGKALVLLTWNWRKLFLNVIHHSFWYVHKIFSPAKKCLEFCYPPSMAYNEDLWDALLCSVVKVLNWHVTFLSLFLKDLYLGLFNFFFLHALNWAGSHLARINMATAADWTKSWFWCAYFS